MLPTVPDGYVLELTRVFDAQHLGTLSFRTGFRAICFRHVAAYSMRCPRQTMTVAAGRAACVVTIRSRDVIATGWSRLLVASAGHDCRSRLLVGPRPMVLIRSGFDISVFDYFFFTVVAIINRRNCSRPCCGRRQGQERGGASRASRTGTMAAPSYGYVSLTPPSSPESLAKA